MSVLLVGGSGLKIREQRKIQKIRRISVLGEGMRRPTYLEWLGPENERIKKLRYLERGPDRPTPPERLGPEN